MTKAKSDKSAQRAAEREAKVRNGMQALAQWLRDLIRSGLGAEAVRRPETWQAISARLWDAQAQGVARQLNAIGVMLQRESEWVPRLLEALGKLHLLVEAYARLDQLTPEQRADVRTAIGFTEKQAELLTQTGTLDLWLALGRQTELNEENLIVQRTWLLGLRTGKMALLLDYAHRTMSEDLDRSFPPATWLETACVYYPSAYPLRAVAKHRESVEAAPTDLPHAHATLRVAFTAYAAALSANPWLERFPMLVAHLTPFYENGDLALVDSNGDALPVAALEPMCLARLLA
ncbi:MAG: SWIM zinc finger family protein, partial [Anaerolineae bacterium]|nr:SWIM zinc finger family protein [Anaerolineae bacterium]